VRERIPSIERVFFYIIFECLGERKARK